METLQDLLARAVCKRTVWFQNPCAQYKYDNFDDLKLLVGILEVLQPSCQCAKDGICRWLYADGGRHYTYICDECRDILYGNFT